MMIEDNTLLQRLRDEVGVPAGEDDRLTVKLAAARRYVAHAVGTATVDDDLLADCIVSCAADLFNMRDARLGVMDVGDDFSEDGLAVWLFDHKGETLPAQFVPNTNGKIQWTFNVTIAPIAIGGDVKSKNTNDLSFAVTNVAHAVYSGK